MVMAPGKVYRGAVELQPSELLGGARVTVRAPEGDETFVLGPEDEAKLFVKTKRENKGPWPFA
jgi:hypothetical protein